MPSSLAGLDAQLVEALERDHRRAQRAVRPDAAAEGEDRQRSIDRSNDPRALLAADPVRNVDRLEAHVVETVVRICGRPRRARRRALPSP